MTTPRGAEERASSIAHALRRRVTREEAVGILQSWQRCDARQARRNLAEHHNGTAGQDAEAARVAAIIDHDAQSRVDPEWG